MTKLERRCRVLLVAYPAAYRRDRGEEIIATLLEATPEGRKRPLIRDILALVVGGLKARAAQHRRLSTAANLRLAMLLGVAIYLGLAAAGYLDDFVYTGIRPLAAPLFGPSGWPALLAGLLLLAAVLAAWLGRRAAIMATALAAGAAVIYVGLSEAAVGFSLGRFLCQLLCVAALIRLAGRPERPARAWLWLVGVIVAAPILPGFIQRFIYWPYLGAGLVLCVLIGAVAWIGIDARPAVALATYLMLFAVPVMLENLATGASNWFDNPSALVAAVIAALAIWRLRRQSVRLQ